MIRSVNGTHYDIIGTSRSNIFVPVSIIHKLTRGASSRINNYNTISDDIVSEHIKSPVINITNITSDDILLIQGVINMIRSRILNHIDSKLKTIPGSLKELGNIVNDMSIGDIISKALYQFITDTTQYDTEVFSTWVYTIDYIINTFTRHVNVSFSQSVLNDRMFKELTQKSLTNTIKATLKSIIESAIDETFDDRGVFLEKVYNKKTLLKTIL